METMSQQIVAACQRLLAQIQELAVELLAISIKMQVLWVAPAELVVLEAYRRLVIRVVLDKVVLEQ